MNIAEILKKCPKGTKLWSPLFGEVTLVSVTSELYSITVSTNKNKEFSFLENGNFIDEYGEAAECMLFPAKHQRDWNKFVIPRANDLPFGTVCVCFCHNTKILLNKILGYYVGNAEYSSFENLRFPYKCDYIIPVDKFNFNDFTFDNKDNYGTAYKEEEV